MTGLTTLLLDDIGELLDLTLGPEECAELKNGHVSGTQPLSAIVTRRDDDEFHDDRNR